jgi:Na+-transporting NADH:ubiquinone oxidoreductase subunit NqrD
MRLPSESKQQLFLKNLIQENCLLSSGLGVIMGVLATVNTDQAFFVASLALLAIMFNSLLASVLSDVFRIQLPLWFRVLATALLLSLLCLALDERISRLPATTRMAVMILSLTPLTYARSKTFADGATPSRALFDAAGSGLGLAAAMLSIGVVREILGSGTLGATALFASPPLPMLEKTFGGFLITAAAIIAFRLANNRASL